MKVTECLLVIEALLDVPVNVKILIKKKVVVNPCLHLNNRRLDFIDEVHHWQ